MSIAKFWRLYIVDNHGSTNFAGINELEMFNSEDGEDLCVGGTPSAIHHHGNWDAQDAFNDVITGTDGWLSKLNITSNVWIQYEFSEPQFVTHFAIRSTSTGLAGTGVSPKTFYLEWSVDGIEWSGANTGSIYEVDDWGSLEKRVFESGVSLIQDYVSGKIISHDGLHIPRLIYVHRESDYKIIGTGYTDATGGYKIRVAMSREVSVMIRVVDESGIYNSVIRENVIPVEMSIV